MADHDHFDDEELVSSNSNQRNWRGILIALLVIVIVLALIVTSVVVLTPPDEGPRVKGGRLHLQDILGHELQPLRFNGSWVSPEQLVFMDQWGGISIMDASNLSTKTLMTNHTYQRINPARFQLSADHRYLLLAKNVQKLFRHSYLAQYIVFDTQTSKEIIVRPSVEYVVADHPYLQLAEWSPSGHGIVMVYNYDIYYRTAPDSLQVYQITNTAVPGVVSHGVPDWLYEEEILGTNKAIWMSKDSHLLVFATFNDSQVEELRFPWYGSLPEGRLYPDIRSLRYPKPGTRNPEVTLTVADLADHSNVRMRVVKVPMSISNQEYYFTAVSWISPTEITIVWLNRPQNLSLVSVCKTPMWHCQETQRVTGDRSGWVDMGDAPLFSPDTNAYITIAPERASAQAGRFLHAIAINIIKRRYAPLTHGMYEVTRLLSWDHFNNVIYFLGIPEGKPGQQHLYRVASEPPRSGVTVQTPYCITCPAKPTPTQSPPFFLEDDIMYKSNSHSNGDSIDFQEEEITATALPPRKQKRQKKDTFGGVLEPPCLYHNAIFSPESSQYYILECLGPGVPTTALYKANIPKPRLLLLLQNNTELKEHLSKIAMPQVKTFPVQISGGYKAHVRLHLPPGLREDEITRYPLVVQVYGGPSSQLVTERWRVDWNTFLAGNKDFIVAQIDGCGSGGQGQKLLHKVYYKLGTVEVEDQLEVTEYLRDNLHYIDQSRVAVWGWSYGGFVATLALASPKNVFQCAVAIAPVTNWRLYDSAYAERYMGLPNLTENYKGYDEANLIKKVQKLKGKMYFLVHGTADDNVHLQQSMALVKALSEAGVLFRQQIYPDESHGLAGVKKHLYASMDQYLDDCFGKMSPNFKSGLRNDMED